MRKVIDEEDKVFDELIYEEVKKAREFKLKYGKKPRMLLHVCCAICASHVINILHNEFDLTLFYYNPNIHPKNEFEKRLSALEMLLEKMNLDKSIDIIVPDYNTSEFFTTCMKYADEKEGGLRCEECFRIRLDYAARYAKENDFDLFTTTLSISPHKDSNVINNVLDEVSNKYAIHAAKANFKKKEGFKKANELTNQFGIYRQAYCGCSYSFRDEQLINNK